MSRHAGELDRGKIKCRRSSLCRKKQEKQVTKDVLAWFGREGRKGKERKGKEQNGEKVAFVGVEPTPSAIRADVLSQLD